MDQNAMLDFFFPEHASDHPTMWWELQVYVRVRVREAGEFVFDKAGVHPKFRPLRGWGRSSVGRAPQWHCGGQGFESPRLHHTEFRDKSSDALRAATGVSAHRFQGFLNTTVRV